MRSGLHSWCKRCQLERVREWRAEHPEAVAASNAKRRRGPILTTCLDCSVSFAARTRQQVRCPECQAANLRARKR
jgi:hypothetical protein